MKIRPMTLSELDDVLDLHVMGLEEELKRLNEIISGKKVDHNGIPSLKKVIYQMYHIGECNMFVAENQSGDFVGYCLATKKIYPIEDPKICGCINGIYVKDEARRQGLGRKLFDAAVEWFKRENINYLELYHMANDERAAAFWQNMGFTVVQLNCVKKL